MNRALLSLSILAIFPVVVACSSSSSGNGAANQGDAASPGSDASQAGDSSSGNEDSSTGSDSGGDDSSSPGTDSGGAGSDAAVGFGANVYGSIIATKCLFCHGPTADGGPGIGIQFGHLDMSTQATAYASLLGDGGGVPADGVACSTLGASGLLRVAPGSPSTSLLYNKLASNDGDGGSILLPDGGPLVFCGNPMPEHHPAISAPDLGTVNAWILQGATP